LPSDAVRAHEGEPSCFQHLINIVTAHHMSNPLYKSIFCIFSLQWLNSVYEILDVVVDAYGGEVTKVETVGGQSHRTIKLGAPLLT
jgi:hypothetical protein